MTYGPMPTGRVVVIVILVGIAYINCLSCSRAPTASSKAGTSAPAENKTVTTIPSESNVLLPNTNVEASRDLTDADGKSVDRADIRVPLPDAIVDRFIPPMFHAMAKSYCVLATPFGGSIILSGHGISGPKLSMGATPIEYYSIDLHETRQVKTGPNSWRIEGVLNVESNLHKGAVAFVIDMETKHSVSQGREWDDAVRATVSWHVSIDK